MFIIIGNNVRLFGPKKVAVSNEERDNGLTTGVRKTGGASLALPKIRKNPLIEIIPINTGKSLSEAFIFASTNPQYDDRLFIELQVQYMKIPSSEHVVYISKLF